MIWNPVNGINVKVIVGGQVGARSSRITRSSQKLDRRYRQRPPIFKGVHMTTVALPSGERVPALGMGTWMIGQNKAARSEEIATIRLGLDLGSSLIDTAEMYGEGRAEELIGEAMAGRRDEIFLVSKVYPHNATRQGAV